MHGQQITVRKRLFSLFLISIFVFMVLIARLAYVQLIAGGELAEKAKDLWSRNIPFEPKRGKILDRNQKKLAYNISSPSVMAIPAQIKDPAKTAKQLARILQAPEEKIYEKITQRQLIVKLHPWGRKISEEKARQIQGLRLPGIAIAEDSKRYYPHGSFAAHLLGFTGVDNQGLAGLELIYDEKLKGKKGYVSFSATASGDKLPGGVDRFIPPQDGLDLMLTLDYQIQTIIERELDQAMAQYQPENALAIAMNPNTGEILGMSSRPTFHPDQYKVTDPLIYNRNLPIWKTYEPGSTFKIITLAAALEEKKMNLQDHFHDPGYIKVGGARLRCWKSGGHGHQTFLEVVENSCNPGFVTLGQRLGKEKLFSYIRKFGFGEKTGIDLNGEALGILFEESQVGPVELATTAFGQGVSVTPIQQVAAVSAAINGGKLMVPHVAKAWVDPETGKVVEEIKPKMKRQVISEATSAQVRQTLESVVAKGTGRKAFVDGYRVGGKTGTAQKVGPDGRYMQNNHIVSFIGFAPADDPQLVVYVAVDNPKGIQFGGVVAAPIVGNILDDSLRYLKIPKRTKQIPPENGPAEIPIVPAPNLVNQDIDEIRSSLYSFPLQVYGKGQKVIDQMPKPGQRVKKGTTIKIYLGDS
ncbi:stage V sporulation protein D [Thermoactinomyces intermedius]|jgi:stage V sporulation protein D (sporulation-specific penicillin-binding protein)|uniref:Stage V sporulation protein D n=1 Tax=Thermoactinomyces intermedius TaxID=2024 RepID=A0A8I1DDT4_THEIN|nr:MULTISPECIES: stage V sporulation protein D [Thermoactinomyces]MBA4547562.1 stage V sporulation protein D [Thermoactinomyces intermedius]MBA4836202.1 stage V sporulation protein D [Thermoactinomyces intermedius]MBH8594209.1 stage V sporulation protein D [Thermoactinomyces intermedius]MBH8601045.1 stage V sporulation protein D [Thermoactinomyces sp. CICC 23799]